MPREEKTNDREMTALFYIYFKQKHNETTNKLLDEIEESTSSWGRKLDQQPLDSSERI